MTPDTIEATLFLDYLSLCLAQITLAIALQELW